MPLHTLLSFPMLTTPLPPPFSPFFLFTPSLSSPHTHHSPPPLLLFTPSLSSPSHPLSPPFMLTSPLLLPLSPFSAHQLDPVHSTAALTCPKTAASHFQKHHTLPGPLCENILASRHTGTIPNSVSSPAGATSLPASEIYSAQCKLPPSDRTIQPLACQTHGCRLPRRNHPVRLLSTS